MLGVFWRSAWGLLAAANLFWAGNIVLARGMAGQVPPVALAYWRWTGAFIVAFGFAWPRLKTDWPVLLRHWKIMLALSATGIASYNTMSYIGLTSTTALNVLLLQSATPLIIIVWAYFLFRDGLPRGSFGKRLVGLSVIEGQSGNRCGYWRSLVRNLFFVVMPYVDVLFVPFSPNGRRLGDHLAGTQVVKKGAPTESAVVPLRLDPTRGKGIAVPLAVFTSSLPSNAPPAATIRVSDGSTESPGSDEVERLTTLNSLREKGLITTELFEAKRRQILQDL